MTDKAGEAPRPTTPEDLDYDLPGAAIAQMPLADRDRARLLVDCGDRIQHRLVSDLPDLLGRGDVLVVNETRVLPARLRMLRSTGGAVEVLLLTERSHGAWEALVRSSRRLREGEILTPRSGSAPVPPPAATETGDGSPHNSALAAHAVAPQAAVEIGADLGEGRRVVRILTRGRQLLDVLDETGAVPLPPYITADIADPERYQTVYARRPGSAAAPTAGLHFTEALLERVSNAGAEVVAVDLAIGLDTFRPITAACLDDHVMHTEQYRVPVEAQEAVNRAERVVAVGTTVVRCLETWAATGEAAGASSLFIRRPYEWRVVDAMMTNFHMPRSTLLCLLDAFVGARWRTLYATALCSDYRFLSFGDAMLVSRAD